MDRLAFLATRDERAAARPSGPTLAEALADRDVALIRIRARYNARLQQYHDLAAFTATYRRVFFNAADHDVDLAVRAGLIAWHLDLHPDIDWTRDHQIDLRTGDVTAAPDAWEDGFLPEDDLTFGGTEAVYLPSGQCHAEQPTPVFPFPPIRSGAAA